MLVKYLGVKKDFKYLGKYDFSSGSCQMPDAEAAVLIKTNPRGFVSLTKKPVVATDTVGITGAGAGEAKP